MKTDQADEERTLMRRRFCKLAVSLAAAWGCGHFSLANAFAAYAKRPPRFQRERDDARLSFYKIVETPLYQYILETRELTGMPAHDVAAHLFFETCLGIHKDKDPRGIAQIEDQTFLNISAKYGPRFVDAIVQARAQAAEQKRHQAQPRCFSLKKAVHHLKRGQAVAVATVPEDPGAALRRTFACLEIDSAGNARIAPGSGNPEAIAKRVLALRDDDFISTLFSVAWLMDNREALEKDRTKPFKNEAGGAIYRLLHIWPERTHAILTSSPNKRILDIVDTPNVIANHGFSKGVTVGQFVQWMRLRSEAVRQSFKQCLSEQKALQALTQAYAQGEQPWLPETVKPSTLAFP